MASLVKRGEVYYLQWRVGGRSRRRSLETTSLQLAREKLRQFESACYRGDDDAGPTKTALAEILGRYADHVRAVKTAKSAQTDIYYLRQMFGPICPQLAVNSRRTSKKALKRPPKPGRDRRFEMVTIEVKYIEQVATADDACILWPQLAKQSTVYRLF